MQPIVSSSSAILRLQVSTNANSYCSGGMGLTGGFADVGGLYDCLYGIYSGRADDSILDKYDEIRQEKYRDVIDPISSGNLKRLWDANAIENDDFIKMIRKADADKEFKNEMQKASSLTMSPKKY